MASHEVFESEDVGLAKRGYALHLATVASVVLALALLASTGGALHPADMFSIALLSMIPLSLAFRRGPSVRVAATTVRATHLGVRIGADRFLPRASLRAGYLVPGPEGTYVCQLERRLRPDVHLVLGRRDEGRRLLRALGLDASQTAAHFRVASRALADPQRIVFLVVCGVALAGASAHLLDTPPFVMAFVLGLVGLCTVVPTFLDVGTDGIVVRWLFRRRFVRFGDIRDAVLYDEWFGRSRMGGVELTLTSGERLKLPVGQPRAQSHRMELLLERIREAMASRGAGAPVEPALLARGDRPLGAWLVHLRALGAGALAGPRTAPVDPERLWATVEDPRGDAVARAAAAVGLASSLDERGRARIRVLGEASADPKLRIALEHIADDAEDERLQADLAELERDAANPPPLRG